MKFRKWMGFWILLSAVGFIFFGCSKYRNLEVEFISEWGGSGSEPGKFNESIGVALDTQGNVYVSDSGNNRIQKFTADGKFVAEWGRAGSSAGFP